MDIRYGHKAVGQGHVDVGPVSLALCDLMKRKMYLLEYKSNYQLQSMGRLGLCQLYRTVLVIIKLTKSAVALRLRCGSCKLIFLTLFHHFFAKFKSVVHSLEPGETPSYSASHQAPTMCNVLKYGKLLSNVAFRLRSFFQFT